MKKFLYAIVTLCGICAATQSPQMSSAAAQTNGVIITMIPLTNQATFTNTVVPVTNLTGIQFSNVVTQLLRLQTNIEQVLPVLDLVQSNAMIISVATPTGNVQTALAVKIGTNTFNIDANTLQALFILRFNLQRSLVVLQALNGTAPTNNSSSPSALFVPPVTTLPPPITNLPPALTNIPAPITSIPPPITHIPPPVTNFTPGPLTNSVTAPPAVTPPIVRPGSLAPF